MHECAPIHLDNPGSGQLASASVKYIRTKSIYTRKHDGSPELDGVYLMVMGSKLAVPVHARWPPLSAICVASRFRTCDETEDAIFFAATAFGWYLR